MTDLMPLVRTVHDRHRAALRGAFPADRLGLAQGEPDSPALAAALRDVLRAAETADLPVTYIGAMPAFAGHIVAPGHGRDWVLTDLAGDPLFAHAGGFPVPDAQLAELRRIQNAGVAFDAIYVAHEVRSGAVSPDAPLELEALLPPPPRAIERLSNRLGAGAARIWNAGRLPIRLATMTATAGAAMAAALPAAIAIDPIVLGVKGAPGRPLGAGEPALWFYLTHWDYGATE